MTQQPQRHPFYRVVVQQGGVHIDVTLSDEDESKAFNFIYRTGQPFQVWAMRRMGPADRHGSSTEMVLIDPALGGVRWVSRPALGIPLDNHGNPMSPQALQAGQQPANVVKPDDRDNYARISLPGRVIVPEWPTMAQQLAALANGFGAMSMLMGREPANPAVLQDVYGGPPSPPNPAPHETDDEQPAGPASFPPAAG